MQMRKKFTFEDFGCLQINLTEVTGSGEGLKTCNILFTTYFHA